MLVQLKAEIQHDTNTQTVATHFAAEDDSQAWKIAYELHHYYGWDRVRMNDRPVNFKNSR